MLKKLTNKRHHVYRRSDNKHLKSFSTRKDAVFYCKVEQTLPLPDYEWEDEFYII